MALPHDIRNSVPQISPELLARFPRVHKQPYPRMMTKEVNGKKVPYKHTNGRPVIVQNADEEQKFLEAQLGNTPKAAETVSVTVDVPKDEPVQAVSVSEPTVKEEPREKRKYTRRTLEA